MYYIEICCDHCNHWVHHTCNALNYLNETTLRSIDYAIFQSLPSYICTGWDQNIKYNIKISILQRKAMRIISISDFNKHATSLFSKKKILKCIDFIQMQNCIFVNKSGSGSLHSLFSQTYLFANDHHNYNTKFASDGLLKIPANNTSIYDTKPFETSTITSWNFFQSHLTGINLKNLLSSKLNI